MASLTDLYSSQGQSIWLDNLSRAHLRNGALRSRIAQGVRGLTSNPTIFAKAIQGSDDYDEQFATLISSGTTATDAYWEMVIDDIRAACDEFHPLFMTSRGVDGFVSVEVAPELARDTNGTLSAAKELHARVDRQNVMIKIPATLEGLPAIRAMIAAGCSVNVTLIFSLERHLDVMEAYIAGLEDYAAQHPGDLSHIASVASFFISRVDSLVDPLLTEVPQLQGHAALAQGRLAYANFMNTFTGDRWKALAARGALVQRPLWASTGTKNPSYSDVVYLDGLIGPDTVNTVPEGTLDSYLDHGSIDRTVDAHSSRDREVWNALAEAGIDMSAVAEQLEDEGVRSFAASFDEVIAALESKAATLRG